MKRRSHRTFLMISLFYTVVGLNNSVVFQELQGDRSVDEKVQNFLEVHRGQWRDMNVPEIDGQLLYDLIVKHDSLASLELETLLQTPILPL